MLPASLRYPVLILSIPCFDVADNHTFHTNCRMVLDRNQQILCDIDGINNVIHALNLSFMQVVVRSLSAAVKLPYLFTEWPELRVARIHESLLDEPMIQTTIRTTLKESKTPALQHVFYCVEDRVVSTVNGSTAIDSARVSGELFCLLEEPAGVHA